MRNVTRKIIIVLTVFAVVGFAVYAFSDEGMGYSQHHRNWGHWLFLNPNLSHMDLSKLNVCIFDVNGVLIDSNSTLKPVCLSATAKGIYGRLGPPAYGLSLLTRIPVGLMKNMVLTGLMKTLPHGAGRSG